MIGYSGNGYRVWNPREEKVVLSRSIKFDGSKNILSIREDASIETKVEVVAKVQNEIMVEIEYENENINDENMVEENVNTHKKNENISELNNPTSQKEVTTRKKPHLNDYFID
ncbi:hypothetical protein WA026_019573 [Henosepilachna vigintioctopunctata]|uniref:Retroviral polymerase SH3-like domain-containing protein n=1 Tax=Henosepilachna vigintioctopunctata TaxID=420089 RepID=A0AAW1TW00_9CUCU